MSWRSLEQDVGCWCARTSVPNPFPTERKRIEDCEPERRGSQSCQPLVFNLLRLTEIISLSRGVNYFQSISLALAADGFLLVHYFLFLFKENENKCPKGRNFLSKRQILQEIPSQTWTFVFSCSWMLSYVQVCEVYTVGSREKRKREKYVSRQVSTSLFLSIHTIGLGTGKKDNVAQQTNPPLDKISFGLLGPYLSYD